MTTLHNFIEYLQKTFLALAWKAFKNLIVNLFRYTDSCFHIQLYLMNHQSLYRPKIELTQMTKKACQNRRHLEKAPHQNPINLWSLTKHSCTACRIWRSLHKILHHVQVPVNHIHSMTYNCRLVVHQQFLDQILQPPQLLICWLMMK